jgi:hypothetical protein
LFSYVILCDFFPVTAEGFPATRIESIKISLPELVLIIWTVTFAADEIRKVFHYILNKNFLNLNKKIVILV